jgi:hypothetical protein
MAHPVLSTIFNTRRTLVFPLAYFIPGWQACSTWRRTASTNNAYVCSNTASTLATCRPWSLPLPTLITLFRSSDFPSVVVSCLLLVPSPCCACARRCYCQLSVAYCIMATPSAPKFGFPGPIGTKRRRMRSGGGVSTLTNNMPRTLDDVDTDSISEKGGKSKGSTSIPIFLKSELLFIAVCKG